MRVTRCPIDLALHSGQTVTLPEETANHLVRVMRLREGDTCVLFNGDGHDYTATLTMAGKREVQVRIDAVQVIANESPLTITLLQGIARGEKMDLILQKATELGVMSIAPLWSQRSEVKLEGERMAKRLAHWRGVVASACEQCGRARVPEVISPVALAVALQAMPVGGLRLILDPEGELTMGAMTLRTGEHFALAVGPEGGWSPLDREQLRDAGFRGLRLGPRVLRTETAGLAAIAALQSRFGDLG